MDIDLLPDLTDIVRKVTHNKALRRVASRHYAILMANEDPLGRDHGDHHPRMSDFGECSLRYVAKNLHLEDLDDTDDSAWIKDTGTLLGAYFGCMLKAGAEAGVASEPFGVHLEIAVAYDGVPGHIDAYCDLGNMVFPVDVKTTPSSSALKAPDLRKLPQCLQTAGYGGGVLPTPAEFFGILTAGYNVGDDKEKNPHPKMRHDWYVTKDYLPLVDTEITRLRALGAITESELSAERMAELADNLNFCGSCRFSRCVENRNPKRFAL